MLRTGSFAMGMWVQKVWGTSPGAHHKNTNLGCRGNLSKKYLIHDSFPWQLHEKPLPHATVARV